MTTLSSTSTHMKTRRNYKSTTRWSSPRNLTTLSFVNTSSWPLLTPSRGLSSTRRAWLEKESFPVWTWRNGTARLSQLSTWDEEMKTSLLIPSTLTSLQYGEATKPHKSLLVVKASTSASTPWTQTTSSSVFFKTRFGETELWIHSLATVLKLKSVRKLRRLCALTLLTTANRNPITSTRTTQNADTKSSRLLPNGQLRDAVPLLTRGYSRSYIARSFLIAWLTQHSASEHHVKYSLAKRQTSAPSCDSSFGNPYTLPP